MNYHAEHHLFAHVPHRHLPAMREAIVACPELRARVTWRSSYCRHFAAYVSNMLAQQQIANEQIIAQSATAQK